MFPNRGKQKKRLSFRGTDCKTASMRAMFRTKPGNDYND